MKTCVYIGANKGDGLYNYIDHDIVYAFEPDPEMYDLCLKRYAYINHVKVINSACGEFNEIKTLYVLENRVGSSLSETSSTETIKSIKQIQVNVVNLFNFLQSRGIDHIDTYVSDAQGSDLSVLKTIKPMVDSKQIETLKIETHNDFIKLYENLDNRFSEFKKILHPNYSLKQASIPSLGKDVFQESDIPVNEKEWDSIWVKNQ